MFIFYLTEYDKYEFQYFSRFKYSYRLFRFPDNGDTRNENWNIILLKQESIKDLRKEYIL